MTKPTSIYQKDSTEIQANLEEIARIEEETRKNRKNLLQVIQNIAIDRLTASSPVEFSYRLEIMSKDVNNLLDNLSILGANELERGILLKEVDTLRQLQNKNTSKKKQK